MRLACCAIGLAGLVAALAAPAGAVASQPADQTAAKANAVSRMAQLVAALHASRNDRGWRVVLPADQLFGGTGDALAEAAEPLLAPLAELIATTHPREVVVAGHTDSVGNDDDNLALSERRAGAVAAWLQDHAPKQRRPRLVEKAYGRTRPVAPNHNADGSDSPDGRARNRRVEILLWR